VANVKPPTAYAGIPRTTVLAANTVLYRLHPKHYPADEFSPVLSQQYYGGGRFDPTKDEVYKYLYAGETVDVAIAECFLRDLMPDDAGVRQLPFARVTGRRISAICVGTDLEIVSLRSGEDLGAVAQDPWLTTCDPRDYAQSRHWGHWIRSHADTACGYVWLSRRESVASAYILFEDRIPPGAITTCSDPGVPSGDSADFDAPRGRRELRNWLSRYRVALSRR
jgi:hypothetical protein